MEQNSFTVTLLIKRSAGVTPQVNVRNPLHTGNKAHKQGIQLGFETGICLSMGVANTPWADTPPWADAPSQADTPQTRHTWGRQNSLDTAIEVGDMHAIGMHPNHYCFQPGTFHRI